MSSRPTGDNWYRRPVPSARWHAQGYCAPRWHSDRTTSGNDAASCNSLQKTGAHKAKSRASAALDPRLATILPQILLDEIPVRERPEVLEKVRSRIAVVRSEEHTSELQSLMRISYAVFCLKK